jgi:cytochrome b
MYKIRVWDLPIRFFHWSLAILVTASIVTAQVGGNAQVWHFRCGYAVMALLMFRLIWGVIGTRYARFSDFLAGPGRILTYLRKGMDYAGHNPLGSLSVLTMLAALAIQVGTGLFSNDDIFSEGPLAVFVSKDWSDKLTWLHTEVGALLIYVLIGLHIAAVLFYTLFKRQKLVSAMITGDKIIPDQAPAAEDSTAKRLVALAVMVLCAVAVYFIVSLKP